MLTDHIGIKVRDIDASVKFYCDNLDFMVDSKFENERSKIVFLKNENTVIELICPKTGEYDFVSSGIINHMAFTVSDIYAYIEKLKKNNVKFDTEAPRELLDKKIIFFAGPDGESLEFVQYVK